ncbi:MAG: phosphatase PAP2 family protein, partial [Bacteroidota bacterium]
MKSKRATDALAVSNPFLGGSRRPVAVMFLALTLVSAPSITHAQDGDRFLRWAGDDIEAFFLGISPESVGLTVGAGLLMIPLSRLDVPIRDRFRGDLPGAAGTAVDAANVVGSVGGSLGISAGLFAISLFTDDTTFQDAAFTSMQTVVLTDIAIVALKTSIGRLRPWRNEGPYVFRPFTDLNSSFPSGHTSAAFALLTPFAVYYPNPFTISLLAVSAGTGFARIAKDKHWFTDVVA